MGLFSLLKADHDHNLDSQSFRNKIKNDLNSIVLDVRTRNEFRSGHISNAVNLDIYSFDFRNQVENLDKSKTYLIYCHSGSRSHSALKYMKSNGFDNIFHLEGWISYWDGEIKIK